MDIGLIRQGLATNAATIAGLRTFAYMPDSIPVPVLFVADIEIEFDKAFGRGMDEITAKCRLLVSHADDRTGQAGLDAYLAGSGAKSVKVALQTARTLGGACDDLRVLSVRGYGLYEHNGTHYYGAEWAVQIIGGG